MPTYVYLNKKTKKIEEHFISIADKDEFQKNNPHLKQQITAPNINYSEMGGALKKAGDGWKEVQDKIKSGLPPRYKDNVKTK